MSAYIIVEVKVNDPQKYEEYKNLVPPTLEKYKGKFLVRGGKVETLEGNWNPERFVILEFPDAEKAKAWWSSPGYSEVKKIRYETANSKMIVVEGI